MPVEVKKIPIILMVEEDVLEFHQNIAQRDKISVEKRLYQLILEHSPQFNRATKEEKFEAMKKFGAEKFPAISLEKMEEDIEELYSKK